VGEGHFGRQPVIGGTCWDGETVVGDEPNATFVFWRLLGEHKGDGRLIDLFRPDRGKIARANEISVWI